MSIGRHHIYPNKKYFPLMSIFLSQVIAVDARGEVVADVASFSVLLALIKNRSGFHD